MSPVTVLITAEPDLLPSWCCRLSHSSPPPLPTKKVPGREPRDLRSSAAIWWPADAKDAPVGRRRANALRSALVRALLGQPLRPAIAVRVDIALGLPAARAGLLKRDQVDARIGGLLLAAREGGRAVEDDGERQYGESDLGIHGRLLLGCRHGFPPCGSPPYNKKNINEISPEIKLLRFCQESSTFQNAAPDTG